MKKVFLNSQENICATVSFLIKETLAQVFSCEFCNKKKKNLSGFSFTNIHESQDSRGRGRVSL